MDKVEIAITNLDSDGTGRLMDMVETFFGDCTVQAGLDSDLQKLQKIYYQLENILDDRWWKNREYDLAPTIEWLFGVNIKKVWIML